MVSESFMIARAMIVAAMLGGAIATTAQTPPALDISKIGPRVGAVVPELSGVDQFGRPHSLQSISGPKGAMLVFFRSSDW